MIKEATGFGETIEEAKEIAIANLNASDLDDIQFDIVTMPKKKVLGIFGGAKAEVRAFIELPDKKVKKAKKEKIQKAGSDKKAEPKKENKPVKQEKPQKEVKKNAQSDFGEAVDASAIEADSPAGKAVDYIKAMLTAFNCEDVEIKVATRENGALILLDGENLSIAIGRRGETLDAIQYLAGLAANNGGGQYKISINIGNYREKREETLTDLAKKISAQVLKTGKPRFLEPMNPYERRIIHTAVQEIEGVVSNSFGEGTQRRVVIAVEGSEVRPPRNNDRRGGRRGDRRRGAKPSSKVEVAPNREPKKDTDIPLYGKIN